MEMTELEQAMTDRLDKAIIAQLKESQMAFFNSDAYISPSRENMEYMKKAQQFIADSSTTLMHALDILLPTIPKILAHGEAIFYVDAHADSFSNEDYLAAGHSGGALNAKGIETAKRYAEYVKSAPPQVIISSDTPRAIHHALAKFFPSALEDRHLTELVENTPYNLLDKRGIIDPATQLGWVEFALQYGIIANPLFRGQFYGWMELLAEKGEKEGREKLEQSLRKEAAKNGMQEAEIQDKLRGYDKRFQGYEEDSKKIEGYNDIQARVITELSKNHPGLTPEAVEHALKRRSDPEYAPADEESFPYTESRADMRKRIASALNILSPDSPIKQDLLRQKTYQVVTHSGPIDIVEAIFESWDHWKLMTDIKNEKGDSRGLTFVAFMDDKNANKTFRYRYKNDPTGCTPALTRTESIVQTLIDNSPDSRIKSIDAKVTPKDRDRSIVMQTEFYTKAKVPGQKEDEILNPDRKVRQRNE